MKVAEFKSRSLKHSVCETNSNLFLSQSGVTVMSLELWKKRYDFSLLYVIKTNLNHYLSSVYFVSQPLHVSGIFVAHHQEVDCMYAKVGTCCIYLMYIWLCSCLINVFLLLNVLLYVYAPIVYLCIYCMFMYSLYVYVSLRLS
jgi:hypothetical protein